MINLSGGKLKEYELREMIGEGGFGAVYRAYQPLIGREVAIKIILPQYANHPDFVRRFETEAQLVARLEHPHIVPLYDYWREPNSAYLVMRWLRGGSLRRALEEGHWELNSVAPLLDQVGTALTVAHRHGVVHRDVKPANILLDDDANAYLADFGIAKDLGSGRDADDESDLMIGSPAYFSPEQIRGATVTPQTDIYSLGILLYELLTGVTPFHDAANPSELIMRHLETPLPSLREVRPDLPAGLDEVLGRATAKEPLDRYADVLTLVGEFRQAIREPDDNLWVGGAASRPSASDGEQFKTVVMGAALLEPENPYKGLRPFQEADADDFFGRDLLVNRLLERLGEPSDVARFLAVVGPSGSGKSSVVKAGLIPALRRGALAGSERWYIVEMVPGHAPLQEVATALHRVAVNAPDNLAEEIRQNAQGMAEAVQRVLPEQDSRLVLFIDQFEEAFTLVEDETERLQFLNSLLAGVTDPDSRLIVIVTLRADFYDKPLLYPQFGDLMRQRTEVVLPLLPVELERVIVAPVERVGVRLEPGLAEAILRDVGEQPGALPLLEYALTELFERRVGHTLTLEAYHSSGGVMGALARRADEIYLGLQADEQEAARQLFLRLVTLGEGTEDTRRRVRQSELLSMGGEHNPIRAVMDVYARYRLLTFDRDPLTRTPIVDVAHEALIQRWTRLREWLDASRDDLRQQRRLTSSAAEWIQSGREHSFLASGVRLVQFEALMKMRSLALNEDERAFIGASVAERSALEAQEEARRAREILLERRSRYRLQVLAVVLLLATTGALFLTAWALNQQRLAQRNALEAQTLALSSSSQLALNDGNTELALVLAMAANRYENAPALAQRSLYEAGYAPGVVRRLLGHQGEVLSVAFSPDGESAVSGGADNRLIVWDAASGRVIRELSGHSNWVRTVVFSPDGQAVLSAGDDNQVIIWDVATGEIVRRFQPDESTVSSAAFSPDGMLIVGGLDNGGLVVWRAGSGDVVRRIGGHSLRVTSIAFSPDGQTVLSGSMDTTLALWNINTGALIRRLEGHTEIVWSAAISPDGRWALSASSDRTVIMWDLVGGGLVRKLEGHTDRVLSVAFSPDGRLAISGSEDNKLIMWQLEDGAALRVLGGHSAQVNSVAFSIDGRSVVSGSYDMTVMLWDIMNGALIRRMSGGHTDWVNDVVFSPDGHLALSAASDGYMVLWDVETGQALRRFEGHTGPVWTVAFSLDGRTILSGSDDTQMILWDVQTGRPLRVFSGHSDWINDVVFSPDGRTAVSASGDHTLILWDVASGAMIRRFEGHTRPVTAAAFTPDGRYMLSGSYDQTLILWDVELGEIARRYEGLSDWVTSLALSPDGRLALVGSTDMTLWDVSSGQIVRRFAEHTGAVAAVTFSPNTLTALSASVDGSIIWWDIGTGTAINRLRGHAGTVTSVAFRPDGRLVVSGSHDASAALWRIDSPDELVVWIYGHRFVPELSCGEREQFRLESVCNPDGVLLTRTPYATHLPTATHTVTVTADPNRQVTTPAATTTLTLTPPPTATATVIPARAMMGRNRGQVPRGDRDAWTFQGQAGDVLRIAVYADRPANDFSGVEREQRRLLDTFLVVRAPDGSILGEADDISPGVTDSRLDLVELPVTGMYIIEVRSYGNQMSGEYTLVIEPAVTATATQTPLPR